MNTRTIENSGFLTVGTRKEVEALEAAGTLINVENRRCGRGSREFVVGDHLEMFGLEEYPHLNGQFVEVTAYRESDGDLNSYYIKSESGEVERWLNFVREKRLKRRTAMLTHEEVMENGATAGDFGIPDSEIELASKVAQAVQNDIDDAWDAMNANIIAKIIIKDWEDMNRLLPDGVKHAMQESFIQAVSQDKLSIDEATTNLEGALIEHDKGERDEAWDDYDMRSAD